MCCTVRPPSVFAISRGQSAFDLDSMLWPIVHREPSRVKVHVSICRVKDRTRSNLTCMRLPFVGSGDTSQPTRSVPHPLKGVWAGFFEQDELDDVKIIGDVDELPAKGGPVWLSC